MKRLTIHFTILLCSISMVGFAQLTEGSKIGANTGNGLNSSKAGVFWNSPSPVSNVIGEFYIDSLWHEGNIRFLQPIGANHSDSLNEVAVRYNVFSGELEVMADRGKNDIRVVKATDLKSFVVKTSRTEKSRFVNAKTFRSEKNLDGFFEVLYDGELVLLKHYYAKTTKPNYNPGFGTGERNTVVRIGSDYYVASDEKVEKFSPGKKAVLSLMKNKEAEINNYIKLNNVDFKNERDLIQLFAFYNK